MRAGEPRVDLVGEGEHRPAFPARDAADGQAVLLGPAHRGANIASEVLGDLLPGIQPLGNASGVGHCWGQISIFYFIESRPDPEDPTSTAQRHFTNSISR